MFIPETQNYFSNYTLLRQIILDFLTVYIGEKVKFWVSVRQTQRFRSDKPKIYFIKTEVLMFLYLFAHITLNI